jgi:hypothetical protein
MKTDTEYLERAVIAMYVREREQSGIAGSITYVAEQTGLPVTRVRAILGWFDNVPKSPDSAFSALVDLHAKIR